MKLSKKHLWFLVGSSCVFLGALVITVFLANQFRTTQEVPGGEVRKIPTDVAKVIQKATPLPGAKTYRVPILLYHYVEYVQDKRDTIRMSLNVNPDIFENQIKTLIASNYTFITAKDLGDIIDGKKDMPNNPIVLTFDDGHWDFATNVLPILKKYNIKATAYIITGFLGGSDFMTKGQLQDVVNSGLVDVGAHTIHHIALKGKLYAVASYEINGSKKMLEDTYHIHVVSFAYPDGSFDQQAINIVSGAGFTTGVSTIRGITQTSQNRFFLYRIRAGFRNGKTLTDLLNVIKP